MHGKSNIKFGNLIWIPEIMEWDFLCYLTIYSYAVQTEETHDISQNGVSTKIEEQ